MLTGLLRVSVAVRDLHAAVATYTAMGLHVHGDVHESPRGLGLRWVEMGDAERVFLELLTPTTADSALARFLEARSEGVYQVRLATPSIDGTLDVLEARGLAVTRDPGTPDGQPRYGWIHPRSTHGVLVELAEHEDRGAA